jgi:hypothetical protein
LKKILSTLALGLLTAVVPHPGDPAEAAILKTTITISTPSYVFASVANPIDVQICSKAKLSATNCEDVSNRKVTLWANNVKVQTLKSIYGITSFNWTPKKSGKFTLKATVETVSSKFRAASSEGKRVTVKPKTKATTISLRTCSSTSCANSLPSKVDLAEDGFIIAAVNSGLTKGRKIRIQTHRVTSKYVDNSSASATWQSEVRKYGMAVEYGSMDPNNWCVAGETQNWNFRFYVDATSKSPAAATKSKWIDIVCPSDEIDEEISEDIQIDFTYSDQTIDSSFDTPGSAYVAVTAPSTSQYSIWTEYCAKDTDCSIDDNWTFLDGYLKSDEIFGSDFFTLSMDPEITGEFWVRVYVIPWTDQNVFTSDWYSLNIY